MTKDNEQQTTTTDSETTPARSTAGIVVRAIAIGVLASAVGMTTACCTVEGEGEGEGE